MARNYVRYDKETLGKIVAENANFADVCRSYGKSPVGGNITNIQLMCRRWDIDTSHMTGSVHSKGQRAKNRKSVNERLVMGNPNDHRVAAHKLRLALFEIGVAHKCNACGISEWNGQPLVLEIDHIDEQYWNNTQENLQFLCPNCHSQKTIAAK